MNKLHTLFVSAFLGLLIVMPAQAQIRIAPVTSIGSTVTCHVGGNKFQYEPDQSLISAQSWDGKTAETQAMFDKVSGYTDLRSNVYTIPVTDKKVNVEICPGDTNYIVYNADWFRSIYDETNNLWVLYAVMAHEIGHYVLGHQHAELGSNPKIELEADEYAGEVLAKMGASLKDAQAAFRSEKMKSKSHTHPPINERLIAVEGGWSKVSEKNVASKRLEEKNVRVGDVNRPNLGFRDSLTRIASDSRNGFSNLIGKPDSRKDIFESEIALPGAIETIVKPYHSVQAWMSNADKLEDAESYYNFLVQQLRLAFPAWKHGEENPDVQKLIKSFVSESNDGQTYISLYVRRINDDSFYVKLNVVTRARKP